MGRYQSVHLDFLGCLWTVELGYRGEGCCLVMLIGKELERDLDGSEDVILPQLIAKLLYALTWNRQIK